MRTGSIQPSGTDFFVTLDRRRFEERPPRLLAAVERDMLTLASPKRGKLGSEVNRDTIRSALIPHGLAPVQPPAREETWSALRIRRSHAGGQGRRAHASASAAFARAS